jgi:hypothetical protein
MTSLLPSSPALAKLRMSAWANPLSSIERSCRSGRGSKGGLCRATKSRPSLGIPRTLVNHWYCQEVAPEIHQECHAQRNEGEDQPAVRLHESGLPCASPKADQAPCSDEGLGIPAMNPATYPSTLAERLPANYICEGFVVPGGERLTDRGRRYGENQRETRAGARYTGHLDRSVVRGHHGFDQA